MFNSNNRAVSSILLIMVGLLCLLLYLSFFSRTKKISALNSSYDNLLSPSASNDSPFPHDPPKKGNRITRKVIMHIGPHKTGSTHIHTYLDKISDVLGENDYCWPVPKGNIQMSNMLAIYFLSKGAGSNIALEWLNDCLKSKKNIILSAEAFDRFGPRDFQDFFFYVQSYHRSHSKSESSPSSSISSATTVSPTLASSSSSFVDIFYDFTIVIIYREWLNHMYSLYTEIHKYNFRGMPFSDYFYKNMDMIQDVSILNMTHLVTSYAPLVGDSKIRLLDYYGIMSAGKDEAFVIVCELMGILCQESAYLNEKSVKENEKPDMIASELFQIVRDSAYMLGCNIANDKREFITDFVKSYRDLSIFNITIPLSWSSLKLLRKIAYEQDQEVRETYRSVLLYGDRSANLAAIHALNITEINRSLFFSDEACLEWLVNEVKVQIKAKRFRDCSKDVREIRPTMLGRERQQMVPTVTSTLSPVFPHKSRNVSERITELRKKVSERFGERR
jgi:hypothetical protein